MRRRRKRKRRRKEEEEKEEKKEKRGGGEEILAGPPIEGSTRDPRRPKNRQFGTSPFLDHFGGYVQTISSSDFNN